MSEHFPFLVRLGGVVSLYNVMPSDQDKGAFGLGLLLGSPQQSLQRGIRWWTLSSTAKWVERLVFMVNHKQTGQLQVAGLEGFVYHLGFYFNSIPAAREGGVLCA